MACRFHLSLEKDDYRTSKREGFAVFKARLRKDGQQWCSTPIDSEAPENGTIRQMENVNETLRLPFEGPESLDMETEITILGWCLLHCKGFKAEIEDLSRDDELIIKQTDIPLLKWDAQAKIARAAARQFEQYYRLDDKTAAVEANPPRPRF